MDFKKNHHSDPLCLGSDDFSEFIEKHAAVIDKTLFIQEWMETGTKASVILRPRRFGKSTNLSMLQAFFSFGAEPKDFKRFLIGYDKEFIANHCGKHPVVYFTLKGIGGKDWNEMLQDLWLCLGKTLSVLMRHLNEEDIKFIGLDYRDAASEPKENIAALWLDRLTFRLHAAHSKRVILLIDEYDAPLNHALRYGFYNEASRFFGKFYTNGLKSNPALNMACLMGIVELRGAGMLSGMNNLVIYSCMDLKFSQYFGFTLSEISDYLKGDELEIANVLKWYNGYWMGSHQLVNPWSFMRYVSSGVFESYWVQTATRDAITSLIQPLLSLDLIKTLAFLYQGNKYSIGKLLMEVNYGEPFNIDMPLSLLVHLGYLTYLDGHVSIPNEEIKWEWRNCGFGVAHSGIISSAYQVKMLKAFEAVTFDTLSLQDLMYEKLLLCSYFDTTSENSYHMFYYGVFSAICGPMATSNREAAHGRYDIRVTFNGINRLFIFELKHSKSFTGLQGDAKDSVRQILANLYFTNGDCTGWTCYAIGV
jgi:hypothetical protein